jgi:hypothetical protein
LWNPDKLALQDRKSVETIRERALKLGASDLVDMCDRDIAARIPARIKASRPNQAGRSRSSGTVTGYHFVCARGRGVTDIGEGRFWSGSWVVAENNARNSAQRSVYLALHESKAEPSYRQGKIVDYRRSPRDMVSDDETGDAPKTEKGIEFLVEETSKAYEWVGDGAGEKGYRWAEGNEELSAAERAS